MPRSDAPVFSAIASAESKPSSMSVNTSRSIADFRAAVRCGAKMVEKNRSGEGWGSVGISRK